MIRLSRFAYMALAGGIVWSPAAQAQTAVPAQPLVERELADMRAQMARMAERIDQLEAQLAAAKTEAAPRAQPATQPLMAAQSVTSPPVPAQPAAQAAARIAWKGGPEITGEGGWSFKPRGRLQLDAARVAAPAGIANSSQLGFSAEARRFYLGVDGALPGGFGYRLEADFANSDVTLTDVFLTYKATRTLTLALGHQKPFWGIEELTSDLFPTTLERASFTSAFGFERRLGLSATYWNNALVVQGGVFTDDLAALGSDANKNWSADGRVVAMPKLGGGTVHLGINAHYRELQGSATSVRYRARPFTHTTDLRLIDTGAFAATGERSLGGEIGYIAGPFHAIAEGHRLTVRRPAGANPTFAGGYAEAGYILTGEDTAYRAGVFERIRPRRPLNAGGLGALQMNVRYDWLDLNDAGILGGNQQIAAASLVWIPTDYVRFIANYGHIWVRGAPLKAAGDPDYSADVLGMRAQVDF